MYINKYIYKRYVTLGMVAHVGDQSIWEVDAKGSRV